MRGIWNVCANGDNATAVIEMGGVEMICELLKHTKSIGVKRQCAGAIGNLALKEAGREVLVEFGAHELLMELAYEEDTEAQRNAASSLSNMALDEGTRSELVEMGCIETMRLMCYDPAAKLPPDADTQRGAAGVLWNIAIGQTYRAQMLEEGCVEVLLSLAHSDHTEKPHVQEPAAGCLALLCFEPGTRDLILEKKALKEIILLTKSADDRVMHAAAEILERFLLEEHMEVLQEEGGVEALQMYARGVVRRRGQLGKDKPRAPAEYPAPPAPHKDKGNHSFATPPPHYRPVTPAPLYEVDAMEWWPNTGDAPLSHQSGNPGADPYVTSGNVGGSDLEFNQGEHALENGTPFMESMIFFNGDALSKPQRPVNAQGAAAKGFPATPVTAAPSHTANTSGSPARNMATPPGGVSPTSKPGSAILQGRQPSRSSGPQRFYF